MPARRGVIDRLLNVILLLAILIAITITVYILVVPKEGERFTEFFILGEKHIAADYPNLVIRGQNYPIFVGVGNQEYRDITYTIETWMVSTEFNTATNITQIIKMEPKDRLSLTLAHNETQIIPYNLSVEKTGYNRVEFLLFNESIPDLGVTGSDRINASYRNLHLGVTVEETEYEDSD